MPLNSLVKVPTAPFPSRYRDGSEAPRSRASVDSPRIAIPPHSVFTKRNRAGTQRMIDHACASFLLRASLTKAFPLTAALAIFAAACAGTAGSPTPDSGLDAAADAVSDAVPPGADAADAGLDATLDAATTCTALVNDSAVVRPTAVDAPLPEGNGAAVRPGRYALVTVRYYGASFVVPAAETWQETAHFSSGAFEIVFRRNGGAEQRASGTLAFAGSTVTTTGVCPTRDAPRDAQFRGEDDTFEVIDAKDARVLGFQRTGP